ncbi:MAG: hypothetical protein Q8K60_09545 [Parachlamydiaceae bacterium]|nr:hypothetical protein [Parachlamydiaceae bacterium]
MKKILFILFCLFYFNEAFSLKYQIEEIIGADTMHEMNIKGDNTKIMVIDQGFDLSHEFYREQITTHDFAPFSSVGEGDFIGLCNEIDNIYKDTMRKINSLKKEKEIEKINKLVCYINRKINWFYKKSNIFLDVGSYTENKKKCDKNNLKILEMLNDKILLSKTKKIDKEIEKIL